VQIVIKLRNCDARELDPLYMERETPV